MVKINTERYLSLKDLPDEIWVDIPEWEGFYKVSNMGRAKAVKRKVVYSNGRVYQYPERILKGHINKKGYDGQKRRYRKYLDSLLKKKRIELELSQPTLW